MIFWCRLGTPILSIFVPTWPQFAPQIGAKIYQQSIQERSYIHPNLHLISNHFLDWYLIDFGSIFNPQIHPKSFQNDQEINLRAQPPNNKNLKKHYVLQCFLLLRPCCDMIKINKNRAMIVTKITLKSTPQLGSIWEPTWLHFGRVWGAKLGQDGTKSLQKSIFKLIKKIITFRIALGIDFYRFWPPTWPLRGGENVWIFALGTLLGRPWGQDGPKTPPKRDFGRFLPWTCSILDPNLLEFRSRLGGYASNFGAHLGWFLVGCTSQII